MRTRDSRAPRAPGATPLATDAPCPTLLLPTPRPLLPATSLPAGGPIRPGSMPSACFVPAQTAEFTWPKEGLHGGLSPGVRGWRAFRCLRLFLHREDDAYLRRIG